MPPDAATPRRLDFADHRRSLDDIRCIYAGVSRRSRGLSIGVNLNPDKVCNFDCPYCQVDRRVPSDDRPVDLAVLVAVADVPAAVEAYAQAFCAPLLAFADAEHPVVAECLTAQRAASGAPLCVGPDVVGYLVRTPATPPQVSQ